VSVRQHRRLKRLEQVRGGTERLRVVDWWPGEPKPEAEEGELLVILKQYDPRSPAEEPQPEHGAAA
jgi:hypothetical protein